MRFTLGRRNEWTLTCEDVLNWTEPGLQYRPCWPLFTAPGRGIANCCKTDFCFVPAWRLFQISAVKWTTSGKQCKDQQQKRNVNKVLQGVNRIYLSFYKREDYWLTCVHFVFENSVKTCLSAYLDVFR